MNFQQPRGCAPVELNAQVALLPRDARCKGLFFLHVIEQARQVDPAADLHRAAGLTARRYLPLLDYPHADWMRLAIAAAAVVNPGGTSATGCGRSGTTRTTRSFAPPWARCSSARSASTWTA